MAEQTRFRRIRYKDPAAARYFDDGCTALPEERAEEEVMSGAAEYIDEAAATLAPAKAQASPPAPKAEPPRAVGYLQRTAFAPRGRCTRVAWVQDFSKRGGAELSNEVVVSAGAECGYDVVGVTPRTFTEEVLRGADIAVVNNVHEFSLAQFDLIRRHLFEYRLPYVKYEHDYRELRRENISRQLFECSRLNVFLSPAHRTGHAHLMSAEALSRSTALPLALDVDKYQPTAMTEERRGVALIPTPRKMGAALMAYVHAHPSDLYLLLGAFSQALPAKRIEYLKPVPAERMTALYARAGTVVHLPELPWAGERVVLEAKLCGCEVVVNANVGHASWEWFAEDNGRLRERLAAAPYQFWRAVGKAIA